MRRKVHCLESVLLSSAAMFSLHSASVENKESEWNEEKTAQEERSVQWENIFLLNGQIFDGSNKKEQTISSEKQVRFECLRNLICCVDERKVFRDELSWIFVFPRSLNQDVLKCFKIKLGFWRTPRCSWTWKEFREEISGDCTGVMSL